MMLLILLAGCKIELAPEGAAAAQTALKRKDKQPELVSDTADGSSLSSPQPSHSHEPAPVGGFLPATTLAGLAPIASNFSDINQGLWDVPPATSAAPDVVGAFRFICGAGQLLYDDPILFPGQPGKSHLHQFYGHVGANAHSTYPSLRASGGSTCNDHSVTLNRSAYWMPAMLDGRGNVVQPDYVSIYYKRRPQSDPLCSLSSGSSQAEGNCIPLPHGLKFIFGYDPTGKNIVRTGAIHFDCNGPTGKPGSYPNLTEALKNCPAGNQLGAIINAPNCWDGKNLDSPDHRSHMAYTQPEPGTGKWKCPTTHPFLIPAFTLGAWYSVTAGDVTLKTVNGAVRSAWELSSDSMEPTQQPGFTFHADFWMAWDPIAVKMWEDNCINRLLNCASGNLGNSKMLKGAGAPSYGWKNPNRLVPVPARPAS